MKKISLFKMFEKRRKVRILTFLASLLVLTCMGSILIAKNPWGANAGVITDDGVTCTFTGVVVSNITTCEDENIIITGAGTEVTFWGTHHFKNVTITDDAKLTHAQVVPGDTIDSTKKVDLVIEGTLILSKGGRIDVSGKGYTGGEVGHEAGYGPGGGVGMISPPLAAGANGVNCSGGGGGYGGKGSIGYRATNNAAATLLAGSVTAAGGTYPSPTIDTFDFGSGGGYASCSNTSAGFVGSSSSMGNNGGGRVHVKADKIQIIYQSGGTPGIYANGNSSSNGYTANASAYGGAGAGGTIWLEANAISSYYSVLKGPYVLPAGARSPINGGAMPGITNRNEFALGFISANGGRDSTNLGSFRAYPAGYGGGGVAKVDSGSFFRMYYIDINDVNDATVNGQLPVKIPAGAEGQDVIIDGTGVEVDAGALAVWQEDGSFEVCPFGSSPEEMQVMFPGAVVSTTRRCWDNPLWLGAALNYYTYTVPFLAGQKCDHLPMLADLHDTRCDSKRHLNSLTIRNGAELTHGAISVADMAEDSNFLGGTMNGSIADNTGGWVRWKKVDIETIQDITLESGGKINVDGKGYPGARDTGENGYGPGGGRSHNIGESDNPRGSGGGFAGRGGAGDFDGGLIYSYQNDLTNTLELGSGGGAAACSEDGEGCPLNCHTEYAHAKGGAGGGRIRLKAFGSLKIKSSDSRISAKGKAQEAVDSEGRSATGGGGSGGAIFISTNAIQFSPAPYLNFLPPDISSAVNGQAGEIKVLGNWQNNAFYNLIAAGEWGGGGGGGGWVVLSKLGYFPKATVKKELFPVSRDSSLAACDWAAPNLSNPNCNFNPYALEKGDRILVKLKTSGTQGASYSMQDDWLKSESGLNMCRPDADVATQINPPKDASVDPLEWNSSETEFSYECVVE